MNFLLPQEILETQSEIGYKKSTLPVCKMLLLGIVGGAFVAFGSQGSNMAKHMIDNVGLANVLSGTLFSAGLMMILIGGAELFTGNALIGIGCLMGHAKWSSMIKNWVIVYFSNLIGSLTIVYIVNMSGQLDASAGALGGYTIKAAAAKVELNFSAAFFSGILCNWLVCTAIWVAAAAKDITGKILGVFFPIWLFVLSGFEHCIANMYFIPAGILAAANGKYAEMAVTRYGVTEAAIENLTVGNCIINNLIPVTLGNIVGGFFFVGCFYFAIYKE